MKTQAVRISREDKPVVEIHLYRDSNGNYFASILSRVSDGEVQTWTATYTTAEEAVLEEFFEYGKQTSVNQYGKDISRIKVWEQEACCSKMVEKNWDEFNRVFISHLKVWMGECYLPNQIRKKRVRASGHRKKSAKHC